MGLRILLAVDESAYSRAAARVALSLLRQVDDAELTALHVVNVVPSSGNLLKDLPGRIGFEPAIVSPEVSERHDERGRFLLAEIKRKAQDFGKDARTVLEHGAVVDRIVHWASPYDLLVMGVRGDTEERFAGQGGGSVHNVLSDLTCPVLLIPKHQRVLTRIAVGYDGSESAKHALEGLGPAARALGLEMVAIYVTGDGRGGEVLDEVDAAMPGVVVTHKVVTSSEAVHVVLAKTAHETGCDVLALGFQGNSPLKDFLFGSATEYITHQTELALYIAH